MGLKEISFLIFIIGINGCASAVSSRRDRVDENKVFTFSQVYRQSKQAQKTTGIPVPALTINPYEGYVKPYVPVIRSPRVIKVWVPAHVLSADKSVMVSGHWTFMMLDATRWFIEGERGEWH